MESIINQLTKQEVWEDFLAYRLRKGRLNWHEFEASDDYVANQNYLPLAQRLAQGEGLGIPTKKLVNKMGSDKKRVVYSYDEDTMRILKLMAYLLYRYDDTFAPHCYAFRRGINAHDAIRHLSRALAGTPMWAYKLDIHDYFNSIPIPRLLPMLSEILADDLPLYAFFERMLTEPKVLFRGEVIEESHGIMAGTPTAPFLADVYLNAVDHYFDNAGIIYARYSDDILLFAPDREQLERHKATLLGFLAELQLEVNPTKEHLFSPEEPYEFLGFQCHGHNIDIAPATLEKMKGKIRRQAHALMRWRGRKDIDAQRAMKALINFFNRKCFTSDDPETLTWTRWFFPLITKTDGLKVIDHYMQQNLRYLSTGRHSKINYRIDYEQLKSLGYRSLVHEYYSTGIDKGF